MTKFQVLPVLCCSFMERGLRSHRCNREDFAGFFVQDDGHVFVAGVEREEADFGFVEGFGG
jgi:hypothetical protein